jgi:hypothetical protein
MANLPQGLTVSQYGLLMGMLGSMIRMREPAAIQRLLERERSKGVDVDRLWEMAKAVYPEAEGLDVPGYE